MKRTLSSFLAVMATLGAGVLGGSTLMTAAGARRVDPYAGLDSLARAMTTIEAHYVEPIDATELARAAVRGMVARLDPHSVYLSPEEYADMIERNEGRWFGVGVELQGQPEGIQVMRVLAGGPADLGGVERGDLVRAVDGEDAETLGMHGVAERLSGERGEAVVLDLERAGSRLQTTLVRDQVLAPTVEGALLGPALAYVRVEQFRQRSTGELVALLAQLEEEAGAPLAGLVLDLRDNPGGLLDEAVAMVDLFVGEALIVETRGRTGSPPEASRSRTDPTDRDLRLVVLVNGGSASAAEIVAGALQDLERAQVVGSPSFGKGSVQQVYEFEDGSALKLTVARYHLPSGRSLELDHGVAPDLLVQMAGPEASESDPPVPWHLAPAQRLAQDPQLKAAWDLLQTAG